MRVKITKDIDMTPYTVLRRGEMGTIVERYEDLGEVDVKMDEYHEGLDMWHNVAHLAEPDTQSIKPCFVCPNSTRLVKFAAAAAVAVLALVGSLSVARPLLAADALIEVEESLGRDYQAWGRYEEIRAKETLWSASKSCLTTNGTLSDGCYRHTGLSES